MTKKKHQLTEEECLVHHGEHGLTVSVTGTQCRRCSECECFISPLHFDGECYGKTEKEESD
jgi:hypothetical protein